MKGIFIDLKTAKLLHNIKKEKEKDKVIKWKETKNEISNK